MKFPACFTKIFDVQCNQCNRFKQKMRKIIKFDGSNWDYLKKTLGNSSLFLKGKHYHTSCPTQPIVTNFVPKMTPMLKFLELLQNS